jgi:hypothetical protein
MGFTRKYLSADGLHQLVRDSICRAKLPNVRSNISWNDCIMSGLAIFGLKAPSLLQFEKDKCNPFIERNLKKLYHVKIVPSDTCLRERLDTTLPECYRRPFKVIFACLQRGKVLERYKYLGGHYLFSLDGTGQYSSQKVHCKNCCEKHHHNEEVTYYHHMLGIVMVHPDERVVIPLAPEPIIKGDGDKKNDCERNASKRMLNDFRREHPHLKTIIVEDGLGSNYPHLALLDSLDMQYIIGVKPGDHAFLFDWVKHAKAKEFTITKDKIKHTFRYVHDVPLNDEHFDYRTNVLEYWEEKPNGKKQHFSWVTSFTITDDNAFEIMRGGRARWRIENETFNTLKNQGYNFEHNYGHGYENLCSVMTMLMMLAFLIDQVKQLCDKLYQKAREKKNSLANLFGNVRFLFEYVVFDSWDMLYETIIDPEARPPPIGVLPVEN